MKQVLERALKIIKRLLCLSAVVSCKLDRCTTARTPPFRTRLYFLHPLSKLSFAVRTFNINFQFLHLLFSCWWSWGSTTVVATPIPISRSVCTHRYILLAPASYRSTFHRHASVGRELSPSHEQRRHRHVCLCRNRLYKTSPVWNRSAVLRLRALTSIY